MRVTESLRACGGVDASSVLFSSGGSAFGRWSKLRSELSSMLFARMVLWEVPLDLVSSCWFDEPALIGALKRDC